MNNNLSYNINNENNFTILVNNFRNMLLKLTTHTLKRDIIDPLINITDNNISLHNFNIICNFF